MWSAAGSKILNARSKCIVALLGTTLIAVVVFNRRSADENILKYQLHGDERVMSRSSRQVAGNSLNTIYNNFDSVQGCCQVPNLLMSEALNFCIPPGQRKERKQKQVAQRQDNGWFGAIRNFYMPPPIVKVAKRKGREAAQKIALSSVCYTDCVFNYLGLMNGTALNLGKIETQFVERNSGTGMWREIIQNAMHTCEEPAACATPETVYVNGKFCNVKCTIMMNCMRQQMLLNCPGAVKSAKCSTGMSQLKRTNVLTLG